MTNLTKNNKSNSNFSTLGILNDESITKSDYFFLSLNFLFNVAKVAISKNSGFKKSFDGL